MFILIIYTMCFDSSTARFVSLLQLESSTFQFVCSPDSHFDTLIIYKSRCGWCRKLTDKIFIMHYSALLFTNPCTLSDLALSEHLFHSLGGEYVFYVWFVNDFALYVYMFMICPGYHFIFDQYKVLLFSVPFCSITC